MFFSGTNNTKKVALRGRSKAEETRESLLQKAQLEREKRKRAKLENNSAVVIQAHWRGRRSWWCIRQQLREQWLQRFSDLVTNRDALLAAIQHDSTILGRLLAFVDPRREDFPLLAHVVAALLLPTAAGSIPHLAAVASADHDARTVGVHRVQRLACMALDALAAHAPHLQQVLAGSRAAPGAAQHPASQLVEGIVSAMAPESWQRGAPQAPTPPASVAHAAAAAVTSRLARCGAFGKLAELLAPLGWAACSAAHPGGGGAAAPAPRTAADLLTTQYVARALALHPPHAVSPQQLAMHRLLFTPFLWRLCPSLVPISRHLTRRALAELAPAAAAQSPQLVTLLPRAQLPGGCMAAAAALLANLLEAGGQVLTPSGDAAAAAHAAQVLAALLPLLPPELLDGSTSPAAARASGGGADDEPSGGVGGAGLPTPSGAPPAPLQAGLQHHRLPDALTARLADLSGPTMCDLLRRMVSNLLPASRADGAGAGASDVGGVRALCMLVWQLCSLPAHRQRLLLSLAWSAGFTSRMWASFLAPAVRARAPAGGGANVVPGLWQPSRDAWEDPGWALPLMVTSLVYAAHMATADLDELSGPRAPLPLSEVWSAEQPRGGFLALLKGALVQVLWVDGDRPAGGSAAGAAAPPARLRQQLGEAGGRLLGLLYDHNGGRPFAPPEVFVADALAGERFVSEAAASKAMAAAQRSEAPPRVWALLQHAPYLVPFQDRARIFQSEVAAAREEHLQAELMAAPLGGYPLGGLGGPGGNRFVTIRREHLLFDGFDALNRAGPALKGRVRVQFVDAHGMPEAGIDGGGLFKDFMEEVVRQGFDPSYGLFSATSAQQLYPSPAGYTTLDEAPALLGFLGRLLAKALWEGILLELPLAGFFLKKLRGSYCDLQDLPSLDPEVYRHLVQLKQYTGNVADLALTFTITTSEFGRVEEVELKPGGASIPVTSDNVTEYIHRVADYRLNRQMARPVRAFLSGFFEVIDPAWVRMFSATELQMLISGSEDGLDLDDLAANVEYAGGYHADHPVIEVLWQALRSFTPSEQRAFLKFVTSCSRAPLLGFRYLEPRLCVQMSGGMLEAGATARLPTASTCMNLLKLPPYRTVEAMRAKLLYAITSAAGFDLS